MRAIWAVLVFASILILGVIGLSAEVYAPPAPKVVICHIPPGNPDNAHTIEVSEYAVDSHLDHGDTLGECGPPGPTCDVPKDPLNGNLIIFANVGEPGDDIGFCGIECKVYSGMDGCPFASVPFDQGTTDEIGMLSFTIPQEEFPVVTVVCELAEVGGLAGHWYWIDLPATMPPFDFDIDRGTNMCCPT